MIDNLYSRRKFIYAGLVGLGSVFILGWNSMKVIAHGNSKVVAQVDPNAVPQNNDAISVVQDTSRAASKNTNENNPCDDLTGVSPEEIEKRKKLAYVNKSPIPDNRCNNCVLSLPPAKGKTCGGCLLFKGPVRAEGHCAYWAPIVNN